MSNFLNEGGLTALSTTPGAVQDEPEAAAAPGGVPTGKPKSMFRLGLDVFLQNRLAIVGLVVIVLFVLFCFVGPHLYHTDQINTNLTETVNGHLVAATQLAPNSVNPLGTDARGFDELGRLMYGGQTSLEVGFAAALIATVVGALWGAISGFFGGFVDTVMMRIVDGILAIPILFLLIFIDSVIGGASKTALIFVLGLTAWLVPARLVRGESLTLRVREYVQAVRVMGGSSWRSVLKHILPNVAGTVIVNATFQVADAILLIAYLGFLGLGIQFPATDWGAMLSDGAQLVTVNAWWLIYPPGIAIILVVTSVNFVGDGLRDAVEVRLQRR